MGGEVEGDGQTKIGMRPKEREKKKRAMAAFAPASTIQPRKRGSVEKTLGKQDSSEGGGRDGTYKEIKVHILCRRQV